MAVHLEFKIEESSRRSLCTFKFLHWTIFNKQLSLNAEVYFINCIIFTVIQSSPIKINIFKIFAVNEKEIIR